QGQTVIVGDVVSFIVEPGGTPPLTFQWQFNGKAFTGANSTSYTISGVKTNDAGEYSVIVSNAVGHAVSSNATLTVLAPFSGIYNTGLDNNRQPLADLTQDPHYKLIVNANDSSSAVTFVEDSTVFPIVNGPWLTNSVKSKWIGP